MEDMKEWFTCGELLQLQLPTLPQGKSALAMFAARHWQKNRELARQVPGKTKPVWQYHINLFPEEVRTVLIAKTINIDTTNDKKRKEIWGRYEQLSEKQKAICRHRAECISFAADLNKGGLTVDAANIVAAKRHNVSVRSIYTWQNMVAGFDRPDWLAALAPSFKANTKTKDVHQEAWDVLVSDYLRPSKPAFSACYRRMVAVAHKNGWQPIPQERVLRRRLNDLVPKAVQMIARQGKEKVANLYPAQRRDRSHLHAMQAVNMDGHKLDVFVAVPWSDKPVRLYLIGIQDLFSGKMLAWRLSDAENWEIVRLVIGDMIEKFGIPEKITLDNGRAFASKWISGGTDNRYRFKIKNDDPEGLLKTFGIETQWTTPYSGKSKPIERAWRDLAEYISKHPFCAGAYTGNKPDAKPEDYGTAAVPFEKFKQHIADVIEQHNARTGRRGGNCHGRSFNETFDDSLRQPTTIIRYATEAQKALFLLAAEAVRAQKGSGEIHFKGNRYWSKELNAFAGQKLAIRFDPDELHKPLRVYDLQNRLICIADCIDDTGFYDQTTARAHNHARRDFVKGIRLQKEAAIKMSPDRLADVYEKASGQKKSDLPKISRTKVSRIVTGNLAVKGEDRPDDEAFEENFSRGIARILNFPKQ
ncbi:transposase domain-containing protein [Bartonella apis]|uniref:transposase domain-containing protein n=1 Tax=Bartonella apis TaxID=1686310 RepID=UPI00242F08CD|nr:transposase domain-containing protein [Bartonella apis]